MKVGVGWVGVMLAVCVGVTYIVAVELAAGGIFVGTNESRSVYVHPERNRLSRRIKQALCMG